MYFQQDTIPDSTNTSADTIGTLAPEIHPVFINEKPGNAGNYPVSHNINRELTPDWVLYFSLGFLLILAWLRLIYTKFIVNIFSATVNYQLAQKVFREAGIVQWRISLFLNVFYFLSTGIFLYLVIDYFEYYPAELAGLKLLGGIYGFLMAYSLFRFIILKATGKVFNKSTLFNEAIFHNLLFNKITGVVVLPFILLIAYTRGIYQDISIYAGLASLVGLYFMRFIRMFIFVKKSNVLLFYFILYLCTLEIMPVLVIIKLIFSL